MSYDINHCTFSGKVEKFKRVQTKIGTPMITFKMKCWKELIKVVAFKEAAETATFNNGDRVKIKGRLQSSSWEYEGVKYRGFQIISDEIEILEDDQADNITDQLVSKVQDFAKKPAPKRTRVRKQTPDQDYREPVQINDNVPF